MVLSIVSFGSKQECKVLCRLVKRVLALLKRLKAKHLHFASFAQRVIDQSNVTWRRNLNTANTALENAANQTNAQNLLNLSNWAVSAAWQQWRDEASWVNTASENDQNRNHNLAMAALERSTAVDLQDQASKDSMYQMIGKFGFDFLSNIGKP